MFVFTFCKLIKTSKTNVHKTRNFYFLEIEAHAQELQAKKKPTVDVPDSERIGLGESGKFDTDIYGSKNKYEGYYDSIAPNEDVEVSTIKLQVFPNAN